jgi:uncharacterized BrkB/YihY/UPF0761 family membrane protein
MQFLDKHKELESNPLLRKLILFLVLSLVLFLGLDILLHYHQIGLTLQTATSNILGNEEEFLDPMLFDTLLEHAHSDTLSAMLTLMLLTTVHLRLNPKKKQTCVHLIFLSAILTQVCLLLSSTLFLFIPLWIGLFLFWHLLALWLGISIMWRLLK